MKKCKVYGVVDNHACS